MLSTLWAVVREGKVELLEQADLTEGTKVLVTVLPDDETDFWRAITTSVKFVWYNFWEVFAMMFVAGLIAVAGVLALGIGLIFTTPLMFLIETAYYVARRDRFLALR